MKSIDSLSQRIAKTVTSRFNDQVTVLINGSRGSGKSYLGLELGTKIAQAVAKINGEIPTNIFHLIMWQL